MSTQFNEFHEMRRDKKKEYRTLVTSNCKN